MSETLSALHEHRDYDVAEKGKYYGIYNSFLNRWVVFGSEKPVEVANLLGHNLYVAVHAGKNTFYTKRGKQLEELPKIPKKSKSRTGRILLPV